MTDHLSIFRAGQAQKICPDGQWDAMMESFRTPLPTTFRINGTGKYAYDIRDTLKTKYFADIAAHTGEKNDAGETIQAPFALPWCVSFCSLFRRSSRRGPLCAPAPPAAVRAARRGASGRRPSRPRPPSRLAPPATR